MADSKKARWKRDIAVGTSFDLGRLYWSSRSGSGTSSCRTICSTPRLLRFIDYTHEPHCQRASWKTFPLNIHYTLWHYCHLLHNRASVMTESAYPLWTGHFYWPFSTEWQYFQPVLLWNKCLFLSIPLYLHHGEAAAKKNDPLGGHLHIYADFCMVRESPLVPGATRFLVRTKVV